MHHKAAGTFYGLSIFVSLTALFVLQPAKTEATTILQQEIKESFTIAWQQVWSDQPYFTDVAAIYSGVAGFYEDAGDATLALISFPQGDEDIVLVFGRAYNIVAYALAQEEATGETGNQIAYYSESSSPEPPIYNIVPDTMAIAANPQSMVLGAQTESSYPEPGSLYNPWFTTTDGLTGQVYCVAIYNGEVNKYLGSCKNEYQ